MALQFVYILMSNICARSVRVLECVNMAGVNISAKTVKVHICLSMSDKSTTALSAVHIFSVFMKKTL